MREVEVSKNYFLNTKKIIFTKKNKILFIQLISSVEIFSRLNINLIASLKLSTTYVAGFSLSFSSCPMKTPVLTRILVHPARLAP